MNRTAKAEKMFNQSNQCFEGRTNHIRKYEYEYEMKDKMWNDKMWNENERVSISACSSLGTAVRGAIYYTS